MKHVHTPPSYSEKHLQELYLIRQAGMFLQKGGVCKSAFMPFLIKDIIHA